MNKLPIILMSGSIHALIEISKGMRAGNTGFQFHPKEKQYMFKDGGWYKGRVAKVNGGECKRIVDWEPLPEGKSPGKCWEQAREMMLLTTAPNEIITSTRNSDSTFTYLLALYINAKMRDISLNNKNETTSAPNDDVVGRGLCEPRQYFVPLEHSKANKD